MTEIEAFYRQHIEAATRFARYVDRSPDADDLAQEALIRCARRADVLREPKAARAYVFRAITRLAMDRSRGSSRRTRRELAVVGGGQVYGAPLGSADRSVEDTVADLDLRRALDVLSIEQRSVVVLRYWLDYSEAQIATTLGIKPGTVKSRLSLAIEVLRPVLAPAGETSPEEVR